MVQQLRVAAGVHGALPGGDPRLVAAQRGRRHHPQDGRQPDPRPPLLGAPPEPGPKWCHRGLVSAWLHDELGLEVFELGQEQCGCGWSHPKLHKGLAQGVLDL